MKILVVDDDDYIRKVITGTLRSAGYEIDECSCGEDAIEKLKLHEYNILLTDIVMPRGDGVSVINYVRANNISVAVIAITSHTDGWNGENHSGLLGLAGYYTDDTLAKPFTKEELLSAVKRLSVKKFKVAEA